MGIIRSTQGYFFPVVSNDELYAYVAEASTYLLASRSVTGTTRSDAEEKALSYAIEMHQKMRQYGIPTAPAYFHDTGENNGYELFNFASELTSGSYSVTINGTTGFPLTVGDNASYTCSFTPSVSSPYLPLYAAQHDAASLGFAGYGQDRILLQVIPSTAVNIDGKLDMTGIYRVYVICSIRCREYAGGWTAEYYIRINKDNILLSGTLMDGAQLIPDDDPISQGGEADNEPAMGSPFTGVGGQGTFSRTSDSVGVPADPVISAVDTGLVTLYVGSSNAMQNLANFLWSGLFDVDTFKKLFTSPMDCIIGSSMLPVTPSKNDAATIIFGDVDTEVSMPRATNQYANVDCGTIKIDEYWGAYLDYSPYSKIQIFLPYIGFKELNIDEVMSKTLGVKYKIDCLSGACTAFITVNGSVYYTYSGSCAIQVPLTANNWGQAISSIIQVAGQAIGGAVTGGAAGALMSGGVAIAQNAVTGGFKPDVQRKGSVTGAGGWLAVQRPYVILEWPRQSKPQSLPKFEGYPANETMFLGQCRGYTRVEEINLDGIPATAPELDEIESLLKGGVLI